MKNRFNSFSDVELIYFFGCLSEYPENGDSSKTEYKIYSQIQILLQGELDKEMETRGLQWATR